MDDTEKYILEHINRVRIKLNKLINELYERSRRHDESKLKEPELSRWKAMDKEPKYPYGSQEYKDKIERYKDVFKMHYKANRHHPEHFENGISDMTLIDLMEMLSDWLSYKEKFRISEAIDLIETQSKRFNYADEVKNMLINTCLEYFTKLEGFEDDTKETREKYNQYEYPYDHGYNYRYHSIDIKA